MSFEIIYVICMYEKNQKKLGCYNRKKKYDVTMSMCRKHVYVYLYI